MRKQLAALRERLEACQNRRVLTDPTAALDIRRMELDRCRERLVSAQERRLAKDRQHFVGLTASLEAMSPLRVLTRGYAIASDAKGGCVKSVSQLDSGDEISLRFADGSADCVVKDVQRS